MHGNLTAAHAGRGVPLLLQRVCLQSTEIVDRQDAYERRASTDLGIGSVRRRGSPSKITFCTATFLHGTDRTHSVQGAEEECNIMTHTVEFGGGTLRVSRGPGATLHTLGSAPDGRTGHTAYSCET